MAVLKAHNGTSWQPYLGHRVTNIEPTTDLFDGLMWLNPTTIETKIYLNGAFRSVGGSKLVSLRNTVAINAETSSVSIGIADFNKDTDILFVFQNTIYVEQVQDYTVSMDSLTINKVSGTWTLPTTFNFVVLKNVATTGTSITTSTTSPSTSQSGDVWLDTSI